MSATAQQRGHPVRFDESAWVWRYVDSGELAPSDGGVERPCVACGLTAEPGYGPDPCTGWVEGLSGFCCGHGVSP